MSVTTEQNMELYINYIHLFKVYNNSPKVSQYHAPHGMW